MKVLLDTGPALWLAAGAPELSDRARELVMDPDNTIYLSAASAWEIAVKHVLGRLPLPEPPETFVPALREAYALLPLPIDEEAALYAHRLPPVHRDPFDRMLVCQAIAHGLQLATPDPDIRRYPVPTIW